MLIILFHSKSIQRWLCTSLNISVNTHCSTLSRTPGLSLHFNSILLKQCTKEAFNPLWLFHVLFYIKSQCLNIYLSFLIHINRKKNSLQWNKLICTEHKYIQIINWAYSPSSNEEAPLATLQPWVYPIWIGWFQFSISEQCNFFTHSLQNSTFEWHKDRTNSIFHVGFKKLWTGPGHFWCGFLGKCCRFPIFCTTHFTLYCTLHLWYSLDLVSVFLF